jgi:sugar O-acyltransferase (sialic acid O-acetyltransferase NeuD family)
MEHQSIIFIGAGGHAKVVLESASRLGLAIRGVHDDHAAPGVCVGGAIEHLGAIPERCDLDGCGYFVTVGDLGVRRRFIARIGMGCVSEAIIDPGAVVSGSAVIGGGVYIGAGAIVNADAAIGSHAIINTGAIVEHDCRIGINTHVAPRAVLGGAVAVGGIGSTVLAGVTIGDGCVIGAGAVVIDDVADGLCVVGNPARRIRSAVRF